MCYDKLKIPHQPNGRRARVNDPATWNTFDACYRAYLHNKKLDFRGIGYVFSKYDPYIGIDCDDCLVNGRLNPHVKELIEYCNSYTEKSPSGNGIHIIIKGDFPEGLKYKQPMDHLGFESLKVVSQRRYFAITGEPLEV